ncbi:hypothetical protein GCM10028791_08830 [Echinicola sediminis]
MKQEQRRNFLKSSALLGAAALSGSAYGHTKASGSHQVNRPTSERTLSQRTLGSGKHGLKVSALGLGCIGMNFHRSFVPDSKLMVTLLRKAADMGLTLFDTAEVYGPFMKNW